MKVTIEPATPAEIEEIDGFRYEPPYDFYDGADDPVENPERFFVARDNVAASNARAITVYDRAGFAATGEHVRTFARWGGVPFVEMELVE